MKLYIFSASRGNDFLAVVAPSEEDARRKCDEYVAAQSEYRRAGSFAAWAKNEYGVESFEPGVVVNISGD